MNQLNEFCQELKRMLVYRSESTMNLLYSLCSDTQSSSVVQLSLSPLYGGYHYSCLGYSIGQLDFHDQSADCKDTEKWICSLEPFLEVVQRKLYRKILLSHSDVCDYWLLNTDGTKVYYEHSECLKDRNFVTKNNVVKIKNGAVIGIGYEVSTIGVNFRHQNEGICWNPPLSMLRVPSADNGVEFGANQLKSMLQGAMFMGNKKLIINCCDSQYMNLRYLSTLWGDYSPCSSELSSLSPITPCFAQLEHLVCIIRIAGNRGVYRKVSLTAACNQIEGRRGPKTKYGTYFKLNDETTHVSPDSSLVFSWISAKGRLYKVSVSCWEEMIIKGKGGHTGYDKPFQLIKIELLNAETGASIYQNPMWLCVLGYRRKEVGLKAIYLSYTARFDIEHFFSFGKKKLLLNDYQTPKVEHFDRWLLLVQLSYWMLYLGRSLGQETYHPWEKYNVKKAAEVQAAKVEAAKVEAAKVETVQVEAAKVETIQAEAVQVQTVQAEAVQVQTIQAEAIQVETIQAEAIQVETIQAEAIQVETIQAEAVQVEVTKASQKQASKKQAQKAQAQNRVLTPIQTKRSFARIIIQSEIKPHIPKPRNKSGGRKKGHIPDKRKRHVVQKKAEYRAEQKAESL